TTPCPCCWVAGWSPGSTPSTKARPGGCCCAACTWSRTPTRSRPGPRPPPPPAGWPPTWAPPGSRPATPWPPPWPGRCAIPCPPERRAAEGGERMIPQRKGTASREAHVDLPEGTVEEEHGRQAFTGRASHLYRTAPPTAWVKVEGPLRPWAFDWNQLTPPDQTDPEGDPLVVLSNTDLTI